jgi:hypothetical protein
MFKDKILLLIIFMSNPTKIDHLTEDDPISGQKFVLVSIITPELIQNCSVRGIKVRGVYGTEQEARIKASELQKRDTLHNIYVAPVGKWLPWEDDPNKAHDEEYAEGELNRIMKGLKENQAKSKMLHEQRKNDLIEKTLKEQEKRKKKLDKKSDLSNDDDLVNNKSSNDTKGQVELESVDINEMESVNKKYDSLQVESEISDLKSELEKTKKELEQEDQNIEKDKTIMKDKTTNLDKINSELVEATQLYEQLASQ